MTRTSLRLVVCCLWVSTTLVACDAAEEEDDRPQLDGKADDVACVDGDYATWFQTDYLPTLRSLAPLEEADLAEAEQAALRKPCSTGDDAYLAWFAAWDSLWSPAAARFDAQIAAFRRTNERQRDYAAFVASLAVEPARLATLQALAFARPDVTGIRGYASWLALYERAIRSSEPPHANTLDILEATMVLNVGEAAHLGVLELARPTTVADGAFVPWMKIFETTYKDLSDGFPVPSNPATADYLGRLKAARPASAGDTDYLSWFVLFDAEDARFHLDVTGFKPISPANDGLLAELEEIRPNGGGERSYVAWLKRLVQRLGTALKDGTELDPDEHAALDRFIAAKPCSAGDTNQASHAKLVERQAELGADASAIITAAAPVPCGF
jgi:hypothetical protein